MQVEAILANIDCHLQTAAATPGTPLHFIYPVFLYAVPMMILKIFFFFFFRQDPEKEPKG